MQAASVNYRTYSLDFWGYGETTRAAEFYSLNGQMALLDGFLEQMGIGRVALIGHGLGALVALNYTIQYPQYVDRVMTIACPANLTSINPKAKTATNSELADLIVPKETEFDAIRSDAAKADKTVLQASLDGLQDGLLTEFWSQSERVCLFVHGEQDSFVLPPSEDQLSQLPALSHAIQFETSGHFPMLDQTNRFHRLLIDFLTLESGESPRELQVKDEWKRRVR